MGNISFTEDGFEDYIFWQKEDKKILKRINILLQDINRSGPSYGIGKPEALKENLSGKWSRRITEEHRLVYTMDENKNVIVSSYKGHYTG